MPRNSARISRTNRPPCGAYRGWGADGAISMAIGAKLMAPHGGLFVLLILALLRRYWVTVAIIASTLVAGLAYAFAERREAGKQRNKVC